jgi:hypothetical protein
MGARQNQTPSEPTTDRWALEDETLNTNRAATPVPLSIGEAKTTIRWLTPIYGQSVVKMPASSSSAKNK